MTCISTGTCAFENNGTDKICVNEGALVKMHVTEIFTLLGCSVAHNGCHLLMIQNNLLVPSSRFMHDGDNQFLSPIKCMKFLQYL